jgi:hypothetical protein
MAHGSAFDRRVAFWSRGPLRRIVRVDACPRPEESTGGGHRRVWSDWLNGLWSWWCQRSRRSRGCRNGSSLDSDLRSTRFGGGARFDRSTGRAPPRPFREHPLTPAPSVQRGGRRRVRWPYSTTGRRAELPTKSGAIECRYPAPCSVAPNTSGSPPRVVVANATGSSARTASWIPSVGGVHRCASRALSPSAGCATVTRGRVLGSFGALIAASVPPTRVPVDRYPRLAGPGPMPALWHVGAGVGALDLGTCSRCSGRVRSAPIQPAPSHALRCPLRSRGGHRRVLGPVIGESRTFAVGMGPAVGARPTARQGGRRRVDIVSVRPYGSARRPEQLAEHQSGAPLPPSRRPPP